MKFEYLQVYLTENGYTAFDGASHCDGDKNLFILLNKLGQDRWEYVQHVRDEDMHYGIVHYHLLRRSLP